MASKRTERRVGLGGWRDAETVVRGCKSELQEQLTSGELMNSMGAIVINTVLYT